MEFEHSFVYIFVVLNGLQGVFIFLFRCVLSEQVRSSMVSWVKQEGLAGLFFGIAHRRFSHRCDRSRNLSVTAASPSEDGDKQQLWYALSHHEAVNTTTSCDLIDGTVNGEATDENSSGCRQESDDNTSTKSSTAPEDSKWRNDGTCWSLVSVCRQVPVTRYPTIEEESDPDC
ncbi:uncharacterized protein [Periplaneta americana]|uniref:uncharacterized protein n=1 Tax=Periplaneta americana TaxID=6978 RepID=UPI0037E9AB8C